MKGLYLYCLVPRGHEPPGGLVGLDDAVVEAFRAGPFDGWVSASERPPASDLASVTRHHDVVRAAAVSTTPLPVRFGAWAADERALAERLEGQRETLAAALTALAGKVELGVHVREAGVHAEDAGAALPTPAEELGAVGASADGSSEAACGRSADGRAYLRELSTRYAARRRRRDRQDAAVRCLREHLGALPADERVRRLASPDLVAVAHLIDREQEARYRELAAAFQGERVGAYRVHVTGPWPPYSFAAP